jgi:hypothetical protein
VYGAGAPTGGGGGGGDIIIGGGGAGCACAILQTTTATTALAQADVGDRAEAQRTAAGSRSLRGRRPHRSASFSLRMRAASASAPDARRSQSCTRVSSCVISSTSTWARCVSGTAGSCVAAGLSASSTSTARIIAIGIFNIPVFARVVRGAAMPIWEREFILAARVAGKNAARISVEHILPNVMNLLIVQATIQFSLGILAEAALSYVGLGAQPPTPSWGRMLADAQTLVSIAPHLALIPGFAIIITVMGLNLMGDGLRDYLNPRLRVART